MSYALDAALEVIAPQMRSADPAMALIAAKCRGLMTGYDARWQRAPYLITGVEAVISSDLYNPETGRKSRTFRTSGKIDVRAVERGTLAKVIFDHKTSSQDISDPNAPYWRQLVVEGQASHYMLLEWLNENKVDVAIWDVIRKPGISPKALSKADLSETLATGLYCDDRLYDLELEELAETKRESNLMYAARLAQDCSRDRPEWYFQRRNIPRLDSEIREYAQEQWEIGQDIIQTRANSRWLRNGGACMLYQTPCKFLGICSGHDTPDSDNWYVKPFVHLELPEDGTDGRGVLTNSRMRTYQTCKRKHYYSYELGIERLEEEERESLAFGNLYHLAAEQYFLSLMKQQQKEITA